MTNEMKETSVTAVHATNILNGIQYVTKNEHNRRRHQDGENEIKIDGPVSPYHPTSTSHCRKHILLSYKDLFLFSDRYNIALISHRCC